MGHCVGEEPSFPCCPPRRIQGGVRLSTARHKVSRASRSSRCLATPSTGRISGPTAVEGGSRRRGMLDCPSSKGPRSVSTSGAGADWTEMEGLTPSPHTRNIAALDPFPLVGCPFLWLDVLFLWLDVGVSTRLNFQQIVDTGDDVLVSMGLQLNSGSALRSEDTPLDGVNPCFAEPNIKERTRPRLSHTTLGTLIGFQCEGLRRFLPSSASGCRDSGLDEFASCHLIAKDLAPPRQPTTPPHRDLPVCLDCRATGCLAAS